MLSAEEGGVGQTTEESELPATLSWGEWVAVGLEKGRDSSRKLARRCRGLARVGRRRFRRAARVGRRGAKTARRRARRLLKRVGREVRLLRRAAKRQARTTSFALLKRLLGPWHRMSTYSNHWRRSQAMVEKWGAEVVHSCDLGGLVGGMRAAKSLGVPHLHDCHELFLERLAFSPFERRMFTAIERTAMRQADVVTVVNQSIGDEIRTRYGVECVVIRNCADKPARIVYRDIRELAGLPAECAVVLYQGGFMAGRGLAEVVRAAAAFPEGARLVMLGYGSLRRDLVEIAEDAGLADRVTFVDAVPPDELLGVTASATVGVVPYQPVSLNNRLALPNKIFEYLSVGVPVVASDVPELRRIVVGHSCGRVYDPFDTAALAKAVAEVLDPTVLVEVRENARVYGEANTWEQERLIFEDVYRRLGS